MLNALTDTSTANPAATQSETQVPIFLTGFARSGTTWVNQLFRDYFDAGFVNEGQFIISFGLHLGRYGDLGKNANRRRLVHDLSRDQFFAILNRNYTVTIDWSRVIAGSPGFPAMVLDVLHQISEQMGKSRIGSKYPVFGRYIDMLNQLFPSCRVVHVIRDGRDCALSHKHMRWGHQNVYSTALHWRRYLRQARSSAKKMSGRYLEIRYEDLLAQPESTMARLEKFVTGAAGEIVTRRFLSDRKLLRPVMIGRWRELMSRRSQAIFEAVAGDALRQCGYPLMDIRRPPSILARCAYTVHDRLIRETWHWTRKVFPTISEYKR